MAVRSRNAVGSNPRIILLEPLAGSTLALKGLLHEIAPAVHLNSTACACSSPVGWAVSQKKCRKLSVWCVAKLWRRSKLSSIFVASFCYCTVRKSFFLCLWRRESVRLNWNKDTIIIWLASLCLSFSVLVVGCLFIFLIHSTMYWRKDRCCHNTLQNKLSLWKKYYAC